MAEAQKSQAALSASALAALATTLGTVAREQSARERGEDVSHIDRATAPGGRYKGQDGSIHDAHGNRYTEEGELESAVARGNATAVIAGATSEAELDSLAEQIEARKKTLREQEKARAEAAKGTKPSPDKGQKANLPGDDDPGEDFSKLGRDALEDRVKEWNLTVTGTGANGTVLKADLVSALHEEQRRRLAAM